LNPADQFKKKLGKKKEGGCVEKTIGSCERVKREKVLKVSFGNLS